MKYRTIVADPPWHYDSWPSLSTSKKLRPGIRIPEDPTYGRRSPIIYPTLAVDVIAALPVAELSEDDAHLYLWTTNRYLRDSYGIAESWGFKFAQLLVWAKTPMGIGPGGTWAQSTEYILFCRRGTLASSRRWDSTWFNWPRMGNAHSRKPDAFLDMVEATSPGPYLEMFARRARFGWDYWGDESLSTVEMPA